MLGKTEWFTYRIFGWGLRPRTKEGWLYIGAFVAVLLAISFLPLPELVKIWSVGIIFGVLVIDTLHMMTQLPKHHDERENMHQLIIERNAAYVGVIGLLLGALYESWRNGFLPLSEFWGLPFNPAWLIVLLAMALAKGVTTLYLNAKG